VPAARPSSTAWEARRDPGTGATGNVGSELVHGLAARDAAVQALARNPSDAEFPSGVAVTSGDLERPAALTPALAGIREVFLLGGFATLELLRRMRGAGVDMSCCSLPRCVVGGQPDNAITRMWVDAEGTVRASGIE